MKITISLVLFLVALACAAFAWFMSAGWFGIEPGNFDAWFAAAVTFFIAGHLPWTRYTSS